MTVCFLRQHDNNLKKKVMHVNIHLSDVKRSTASFNLFSDRAALPGI